MREAGGVGGVWGERVRIAVGWRTRLVVRWRTVRKVVSIFGGGREGGWDDETMGAELELEGVAIGFGFFLLRVVVQPH